MLAVAHSTAEAALSPGEVLAGKYRVERVLGRGGMGVVLQASNLMLGERVAIKVLAPGAPRSATVRLLMEARAAARLESDHVVRVFDVGNTENGEPYLVMEYLEGQALSDVVRHRERAPVSQAVQWILEAMDALAEAHGHGIVHRDVKPANLFLERRRDGSTRIKVLDFGIAKFLEGEGLSTTTHAIGSPTYMAPEQLANQKDVDRRVDVWGIGCVLYELLTGQSPFRAVSLFDLAAKVSRGTYERADAARPELSPVLSSVLDRCLEPDRDRRFPDLLELARALRPFAPPHSAALIRRIERVHRGHHVDATLDPDPGQSLIVASLDDTDDALKGSTRALSSSLSVVPKSRRAQAATYAGVALGVLLGASLMLQRWRAPGPAASAPVPLDRVNLPLEPSAIRSERERDLAPSSAEPERAPPAAASGLPTAPSSATKIPQASRFARLSTPSRSVQSPPLSTATRVVQPAPADSPPGMMGGAGAEPPTGPGPLPLDRRPPW